MSRPLVWRETPSERLFQVFDRRRVCRGTWTAEDKARAELARRRGGHMLVLDEYCGKLPYFYHRKRVVVGIVRYAEAA